MRAGADAAAFICKGGSYTESASSIAEATASAFAKAVASASAECNLSGDASAVVNAKADAEAAANVWVEAYASAVAAAGDCDKCSAFAESEGFIKKEVFLKAVASAEVMVRSIASASEYCMLGLPF